MAPSTAPAAGDRARPGREVRGLRHAGAPRATPATSSSSRTARWPCVTAERRRAQHARRRAGASATRCASLGPDHGREGRLQALHAQGDPRAAARHRRHAPRPASRLEPRRRPAARRRRWTPRRSGAPARRARGLRHRAGTPRLLGPLDDRAAGRRCRPRSISPPSSATATPLVGPETLVVAITQSGETADTLGAVKAARPSGGARSSPSATWSARRSRARRRRCSTSTPARRSAWPRPRRSRRMLVGLLPARPVARPAARRPAPPRTCASACTTCVEIPRLVGEDARAGRRRWRAGPAPVRRARDFLFLGRGLQYPVALEGALKLKEISYIHAEGYAGGEMKHGPIALIDEGMPVVAIAPRDELLREDDEQHRGGARPRGPGHRDRPDRRRARRRARPQHVIEVPPAAELLAPLVTVIPLQLLAYHIAVLRGCDVDQPRNLAKSVTSSSPRAPSTLHWHLDREERHPFGRRSPDAAQWEPIGFPPPWPDRPWIFAVMVASANGVVAWRRDGAARRSGAGDPGWRPPGVRPGSRTRS